MFLINGRLCNLTEITEMVAKKKGDLVSVCSVCGVFYAFKSAKGAEGGLSHGYCDICIKSMC